MEMSDEEEMFDVMGAELLASNQMVSESSPLLAAGSKISANCNFHNCSNSIDGNCQSKVIEGIRIIVKVAIRNDKNEMEFFDG